MTKAIGNSETPFFAFDADDVTSRKDAISFALRIADKGDIVYLTGKAHEESLAFGADQREYPWNEEDVTKGTFDRLY